MKNRLARVNEVIKREISVMISRDIDFDGALVTVQAAEITPDLRSCRIHIGIIGNEGQQRRALEKLEAQRIDFQARIAKRVVLKYTPQLSFHLDDSVARGVRVVQILEDLDHDSAPSSPERS